MPMWRRFRKLELYVLIACSGRDAYIVDQTHRFPPARCRLGVLFL